MNYRLIDGSLGPLSAAHQSQKKRIQSHFDSLWFPQWY